MPYPPSPTLDLLGILHSIYHFFITEYETKVAIEERDKVENESSTLERTIQDKGRLDFKEIEKIFTHISSTEIQLNQTKMEQEPDLEHQP